MNTPYPTATTDRRKFLIGLAVWNHANRRSIEEYRLHPFSLCTHFGGRGPQEPKPPVEKPTSCERPTCGRGPYRRGLCTSHYRHFLRNRKVSA